MYHERNKPQGVGREVHKILSLPLVIIRDKVPGVVLRTTMIVGFPGETEEQFEELCNFIHEVKFERLGCFTYSREEDTPAAEMADRSVGGE